MHTHNAKQEALKVITSLPDTVELEEIVYRLYVINKIQQANARSRRGPRHQQRGAAT